MKKKKSKLKMRGVKDKRILKKKSFLENQKKHKESLKRAVRDPSLKVDDTRVRFENFSSQVSGIEGSIVYQLAGRGTIQIDPDSSASVLSETLNFWREMNLSAQFQELDKKLSRYTSLTQVIFSRGDIVSTLVTYLQAGTALSLQPMLELLAALATDLQTEFCPHLVTVLETLMSGPFKIRDANVIKWSVKCVGHLLKVLWRPICSDLGPGPVYRVLEQLLATARPDYIRYLSAETLAFMLRRAADKEAFLDTILDYDEAVTDGVAVAKLLFESIKTVNEQFNAHCTKLWPLYLRKLSETFARFEILLKVCEFCADHSTKEHLTPLLEAIFRQTDTLKTDNPQLRSPHIDQIEKHLKLISLFLRYKSGKLISNAESVVQIIEVDAALAYPTTRYDLMDLSTLFLKADKLSRTQQQNDKVVERILSSPQIPLEGKLDFVASFFDHPDFDRVLLRPYLVLAQEHVSGHVAEVSHHLSCLVEARCPLPTTGDQLRAWSPPVIDLVIAKQLRSVPNQEKFPSVILNNLSEHTPALDMKHAVVSLAALRPVKRSELVEKISLIVSCIVNSSEKEKLELLPILITVLSKSLQADDSVSKHISLEVVTKLYMEHPDSKDQIQVLNFFLSGLNIDSKIDEEQTMSLISSLQRNLSSPDGDIRVMCLQSIIILLPNLGKKVKKCHPECQMSVEDVFACLLSAENAGESLSSYKEKLNTLERVEFQRIVKVFKDFDGLLVAPLHYLLGLLYTNFTLLWNPVMDLIGSFGNGMKRDVFWPIYLEKLVKSDNDIRVVLENIKLRREVENTSRLDHISYRNHLWEVMGKFSQLAEAKNRDLVPLFLDTFMKEEYIEIRKLAEDNETESTHKNVIQSTVKSLLSHLNLFVKFLDLKSLHRSPELKEFVHSLLCHKLAAVQKVALDILVAFKLKYLLPYKENLGRLLEEKDFKSELLTFPLGGEDTQIKAEHREELLPVILRLLYGRMRAVKAGGRKARKGNVNARRGLILQHMLELSEEEMLIFFELVFKDLFTGSSLQKGECVAQYILSGKDCPEKTTKQLQACIEMMQVIMSKMGKLLDTSLQYLASVILWMGYILQHLPNTDTVRSVRNSLYSLLAAFYNKYTDFVWGAAATEAVMAVLVWNVLPKFETDFIHSSSGLLQLLLAWSKNSRLHEHFLKTSTEENAPRILESVCKVLSNCATNPKVILTILNIIHNLVIIENDEEEEVSEVDHASKPGIKIVLSEMDTILNYFQTWIKSSNENIKNLTKVGIKLDILITLAPHVTSSDCSVLLLKQLLTMSNSLKKAESVLKVLTISKLLVTHIATADIQPLVQIMVPMFSRVSTRNERLELCSVLQNCAVQDPTMNLLAEICTDLNSYDKRRVEEPDFERRMKVFKKVRDIVKDDVGMSILELSCVIYNCFFFIKNDTDSSLKANSLEALNSTCKLMQQMSKTNPDVSKVLIDKICLDNIKNGIKNKDDSIRCDFLSFLQSLVTHCAEASHRLKDLSKLIDTDPDSNILENLRHVQLHRRGRAMAKIATSLDSDGSFIKAKNLTQLLLPLAGSYLLTDSYAKNSDLVDQAISLVRSIARVLPWAQYEHSVKYYIQMFTKDTQHQKQLVKITSAILDAFHFEVGDMWDNMKQPGKEESTEGKTKEEIQKGKIFWTVNNVLLPKLHGTLSGKTKGPTAISDEDKLILRVPLAIPIIKMLKILSGRLLYRQVPGIVNKIVSFLKSKAIEIREAARSTLCSAIQLLGPKYLVFVIKEMSAQLTRGYLQHVLTFTSHSLLCKLAEQNMLVSGDLDTLVPLVTDMALTEMFSSLAEEKEVRKITGKVMEARGSKCYDMLQITAKFISNDQVFNLAKPFADKATQLSTFKNLQKIRESFRNIVLGLLDNKDLDAVSCLIFIYGIVMDKLDIGANTKKQENTLDKQSNLSIFIVPVAPKRTGAVAKNSQSASQHIVHEFGLNLLYFLLKRGSLVATEDLHCERLEPFINILISSLDSSHVSLITTAVRCLFWLVKFPLKVLENSKVMEITNKVFDLLNKFGGGTDGKGENHDLVVIASKLLVILIRDVELTMLDQKHLKTVLTYVVNDVLDPFKATTAFGLLTAILNRRLETDSTELHDVMIKMIELSVQSTSVQTRQAARATVVTYVKNYNLKKKLARLLDLYTAQLGYEHEYGRLSAAESIKLLVGVMGPDKTDAQAAFLFVSLSPHLVNDESSSCRKALAGTLAALVRGVSAGVAAKLLQTALTWFQSPSNPGHTQLGCHLLTIFVDTLGAAPALAARLDTVLAHLPSCLASNSDTEDHLTIQALTLLSRVFQTPGLRDPAALCRDHVSAWRGVHTCLLHSHAWARLLAAQLLGLHLGGLSPEKIAEHCVKKTPGAWIQEAGTLRSLVLDSIEQLGLVTDADNDIGTQIVKNIVALMKVTLVKDWEAVMEDSEEKVTFAWIIRKCLKVANQELVSAPKTATKRVLVFNLVAAACLGADPAAVEAVLRLVLPPLHRAVTGPLAELKQHCQEVLDLIKAQVNPDTFSEVYLEIQMNLSKKKGERAQSKKQNLILNPEAAAKRKIKMHESKKRAKKAKFNK